MPSTSSDAPARALRRPLAILTLLLAGCTFQSAPRYARPALPLPDELASRFELPEPPHLVELTSDHDGLVEHGLLTCGEEEIQFHLHRADLPERPLVLLVPILAGGDDLMQTLARRMVDHGFHAAWCERAGPALRAPQRARDLEILFRRTVIHQRALLAWLHERADPRPRATFALGVSMGGMIAVALTAVEPSLDGAAFCLAGADLPAIMLDSTEARIESWRDWRRDIDGVASTPLLLELSRHLLSDPARLAPHIDTDRVFMVSAAFDSVVRPRHQDLLWEALGRPDRLTVPLGHYSAALALGPILTAVSGFFADRMAALGPTRHP